MTEALKLYGPAVGNLAVTIGLYFHLKSQIKVAQTPPLEDIYARLDEIEKILKGIVPALQNHDKVIRAITTRPPPQNGENDEKKGKAKPKKGTPKTTKVVSEAETEVEEDLEEGVTEVEEDTRPKPKRATKRGKTKGKAKTNATPKAKKLTKEEAEEIWVEGQAPDDDKIDDILGLNETTGADEEEEIELEYEITESEPPPKAKAKSQSKSFRKPKSS